MTYMMMMLIIKITLNIPNIMAGDERVERSVQRGGDSAEAFGAGVPMENGISEAVGDYKKLPSSAVVASSNGVDQQTRRVFNRS